MNKDDDSTQDRAARDLLGMSDENFGKLSTVLAAYAMSLRKPGKPVSRCPRRPPVDPSWYLNPENTLQFRLMAHGITWRDD